MDIAIDPPKADEQSLFDWFTAMWPNDENSVLELRAISTSGIYRAFFDDARAFAKEAKRLNDAGYNTFLTLNGVRRSDFESEVNQRAKTGQSTKDPNILKRTRLLVDLDPVRPAGISATNEERGRAFTRAKELSSYLIEQGWPKALLASSGNGYHAIWQIDLPNDEQNYALVQAVLESLAERFADECVDIDLSVANASRVSKCIGSIAKKGPHTSERPWRLAELISSSKQWVTVTEEQLRAIAGEKLSAANESQERGSEVISSARRVPQVHLLAEAVKRIEKEGGRNNSGLWLAVQNRDAKYSKDETLAIADEWIAQAYPEASSAERRVKAKEFRASVRQAFKRPARAAWKSSLFHVDHRGVFARSQEEGEDTEIRISARLELKALVRDANGDDWSRLFTFADMDGTEREILLANAENHTASKEPLVKLSKAGFEISDHPQADSLLLRYIKSTKTDRRMLLVDKLGWNGDLFVLPERTIGEQRHEEIVYQHRGAPHRFHTQGSLEEWRTAVSMPCIGNSRLVLAISAAFASTLLPLLGRPGLGIHIRGTTSTGKTTALRVAGSVQGGSASGFVRNWRSTANGLEGLAVSHNHLMLSLDELAQIDPRAAGEAAYMLVNGQGKERMTKDISIRRSATWNLVFLSSGEISLAEHAKSVDKSKVTKGGQEVRLIDLPADAGLNMGLFERTPDGVSSVKAFADDLNTAANHFYGTALDAWLNYAVANRESLIDEAQRRVSAFLERHAKDASPEVARVAHCFAVLAAAGELASTRGITGWPEGEATRAAVKCFQAWLSSRGTPGSYDVEEGIRRVRRFIQAHGMSRFENLDSGYQAIEGAVEPRVFNRAGYKRKVKAQVEYLFPAEIFKSEVCSGFDYQAVARELANRGLLATEGRSLKVKRSLPEIGVTRVFAIDASILEDDEDRFQTEASDLPRAA